MIIINGNVITSSIFPLLYSNNAKKNSYIILLPVSSSNWQTFSLMAKYIRIKFSETQWTVLLKHITTWGKINTENNYINTSDNKKDAITALCFIQGLPEA